MPERVITLDIDWAPDWIIDSCRETLEAFDARATWFVTHESEAVDRIAARPDLFELGIHPNCLPGSSHGRTERDVLKHMKDLLPSAISMRTHSLYQSSPFLNLAVEFGIRNDASLLLPWAQGLTPHTMSYLDGSLTRLPCFWEDDVAALEKDAAWSLDHDAFHGSGLKIFDFHPVHVVLNTQTMDTYEALKAERPLSQWTRDFISPHVNDGPGSGTLFRELAKTLSGSGTTLAQAASTFRGQS